MLEPGVHVGKAMGAIGGLCGGKLRPRAAVDKPEQPCEPRGLVAVRLGGHGKHASRVGDKQPGPHRFAGRAGGNHAAHERRTEFGKLRHVRGAVQPESPDWRVSRVFTPRSFRHYQTLGCIDPPERAGKQAVYGFRHFAQALLVRRLLAERVPAKRMAGLMAGWSTEEKEGMLFGEEAPT